MIIEYFSFSAKQQNRW